MTLPSLLNPAVAARLKECRIKRGITHLELSMASNVNVQQIQKYEDASMPLTSSIVYLFAKLFKVPVEYFVNISDIKLEDEYLLNTENDNDNYCFNSLVAEDAAEYLGQLKFDDISPGLNKEVLLLVKVFIEIRNPLIRQKIIELIKAIIFNGVNYTPLP